MSKKKLLVYLVACVGVLFAFQGGEYSTLNWWQLRRSVGDEKAAIAELELELDSLRSLADALESDPAMQERIAREWFGMVRPGETLYRIVPR